MLCIMTQYVPRCLGVGRARPVWVVGTWPPVTAPGMEIAANAPDTAPTHRTTPGGRPMRSWQMVASPCHTDCF